MFYSFSTLLLLISSSINAKNRNNKVEHSKDYARHSLNPTSIPEIWEDGLRTTASKENYEWWYFDAHLSDGSTVVITFMTKSAITLGDDLSPSILLNIDRPNGTKIAKSIKINKKYFSASKEKCEVKFGGNYFKGNLENY